LTDESTENILGTYQTEIQVRENKLKTTLDKQDAINTKNIKIRQEIRRESNRVQQLRSQIDKAQELVIYSQKKLGALEEKERQLTEIRRRSQELTEEIDKLREESQKYQILEGAFDKSGIPTLIIENVIPEIEVLANKILSVLSDGTMEVYLKTQKTLKTGGTGDTLDIVIKVLTQIRTYGMLSDGQRFRVDLALRIALSSILARRNNFKCQSLILDEGFGSLDESGRQKFVELSQLLSDTFNRLVIITHTDLTEYFKDLVRVRLENGSSVIDG